MQTIKVESFQKPVTRRLSICCPLTLWKILYTFQLQKTCSFLGFGKFITLLTISCNKKRDEIQQSTVSFPYVNENTVGSSVCRFTTGTFPGVGINPSFCMYSVCSCQPPEFTINTPRWLQYPTTWT